MARPAGMNINAAQQALNYGNVGGQTPGRGLNALISQQTDPVAQQALAAQIAQQPLAIGPGQGGGALVPVSGGQGLAAAQQAALQQPGQAAGALGQGGAQAGFPLTNVQALPGATGDLVSQASLASGGAGNALGSAGAASDYALGLGAATQMSAMGGLGGQAAQVAIPQTTGTPMGMTMGSAGGPAGAYGAADASGGLGAAATNATGLPYGASTVASDLPYAEGASGLGNIAGRFAGLGSKEAWLNELGLGADAGIGSIAGGLATNVGLPFAAGQLGSTLINAAPGGDTIGGHALSEAAKDAGIGAAIANVVPIEGVNWAVGAGLGGLYGGIKGLLDYGNTSDGGGISKTLDQSTTKLNNILDQFGASDDLKKTALMQLQIGAVNASSPADVKNALSQITGNLSTELAADRQQQLTDNYRSAAQAAVQSWLGPMMQQQLSQSQLYANSAADNMAHAANQYSDPALRDNALALANLTRSGASNLGTSVLGQLAATPYLYGMNTGTNNQGIANQDLYSVLNAQPYAGGGQAAQVKTTNRQTTTSSAPKTK